LLGGGRRCGRKRDRPAAGRHGRLPRPLSEIADYLSAKGLAVALDYSSRRGDTFEADHEKGVYTWTFNTGGIIVVKDIARLVWGLSVEV
jgi:hypothetical protein